MSLSLKLGWCSFFAAKYAVEKWHYSKVMPGFKTAKIGVWEDNKFIGVLVYGLGSGGACDGRQYGLARHFEMAELQRVALNKHKVQVSKCIAISLKMIKNRYPKLQLIVSYADSKHGHIGKIYQASNWLYVGKVVTNDAILISGKVFHTRSVRQKYSRFGGIEYVRKYIDPNVKYVKTPEKYKYLYPLNVELKNELLKLAKPYPKSAGAEVETGCATSTDKDGSNPIPAL